MDRQHSMTSIAMLKLSTTIQRVSWVGVSLRPSTRSDSYQMRAVRRYRVPKCGQIASKGNYKDSCKGPGSCEGCHKVTGSSVMAQQCKSRDKQRN